MLALCLCITINTHHREKFSGDSEKHSNDDSDDGHENDEGAWWTSFNVYIIQRVRVTPFQIIRRVMLVSNMLTKPNKRLRSNGT